MVYEGCFYPIDGLLAQMGVNKILGYVIFFFGLIPSWDL